MNDVHNDLAKAICNALDQQELALHYQPQFDPESEDIAGLEAFLRWQPPGRALQRASQFISAIEGSEQLVQRIDHWVLATALSQADAWLARDYAFGTLSLNLSSWHADDSLQRLLQEQLTKGRLNAKQLALECPWRLLQQDREKVLAAMDRFSRIGCVLVLNDHPLDDACLDIVHRSPIRLGKVGVDYLQDLMQQEGERALAKRIKRWSKAGIEVAAIGVEQEQQQQLCKQVGCCLSQGNRFKSPLPAADMGQLLEMIKQTKSAFSLI